MARELKRIVLVGPVYPYKGGIAHYTGLLYRNLSKAYGVDMISYEVQYPKILFRRPQKDYDNDTFRIEETKYVLHTAKPGNWKEVACYIGSLRAQLVIVQWWHPYFAPCYRGLIKRLGGNIKVLFICHNVFPHERFPLDRALTRGTLARGDRFIVHSEQDARDLLSIKPDAVYEKAVLPTYNAFKFTDMGKAEARGLLDIPEEEKVVLFFGFVREYKGLRYLIAALPEIRKAHGGARLLIVGDFGKRRDEYTRLIEDTGESAAVGVYDGYIPDKEVEKFFAAADLVALPYVSATQSAVVQIAYGFGKPVVVTGVGGLPEVVPDGKTGYVVPPRDPRAIAAAVNRFFAEGKAAEFGENVKKEAYRYDWDRMREAVERLYGHEG